MPQSRLDPVTSKRFLTVSATTAADIDEAVESAEKAFCGVQATTLLAERRSFLHKLADLIEWDVEKSALLEAIDVMVLFNEYRGTRYFSSD
ncbi:hypothetical protein H2198_002298 [Neophaeococcomyces mojaviensis]|uniref:Uncharacterized protein n=1 Tax=Neophaeococcomyces mojaviensis TaxID=3383035 RepID=A0ACC3AET7_9EURO|nr:hypothetical protein H2198_002298 [Knufia sp. JES_112]